MTFTVCERAQISGSFNDECNSADSTDTAPFPDRLYCLALPPESQPIECEAFQIIDDVFDALRGIELYDFDDMDVPAPTLGPTPIR